MPIRVNDEAGVYLLTKVEFQVGDTPVRLYGGLHLSNTAPAEFVVANQLHAPFPDAGTAEIREPFGMRGIVLEELNLRATITRDTGGGSRFDMVLLARAIFPNPKLKGLRLDASLVFEQSTPKLVLVRLTTASPLTLTDFIQAVLGGSWEAADVVTNQFAFSDGAMYYLKSEKEFSSGGLLYHPGYRIAARFSVLGVDFQAELAVRDKNTVTLSGKASQLDFYFIKFEEPAIQISTEANKKYLRLDTGVWVFGKFVAQTQVSYRSDLKLFAGTVNSGPLTVAFTWTRIEGKTEIRITEFGGIPRQALDLAHQFQEFLQMARTRGCEKLLTDWIDGFSKATIQVNTNGSPEKDGDGWMKVPLKLTYKLDLGGYPFTEQVIEMPFRVRIPKGLPDLPAAIGESLVRSAGSIAEAMLTNHATYQALAYAIGKKYGAAAAARMICRALERGWQDVAQQIASKAGEFVAGSLADSAELAAVVAGLITPVVRGIIDDFLDFIKKIIDIFKRQEREDEDNRKINTLAQPIRDQLARIDRLIDSAKRARIVRSLRTAVTEDGGSVAVSWSVDGSGSPGDGLTASYRVQLLDGDPGTSPQPIWPGTVPYSYADGQTSAAIPLTDPTREYRFNASISAVITGEFVSQSAKDQMNNAINALSNARLSAASSLADQMRTELNRLTQYNEHGIVCDPVYAQSDVPAWLTIGRSRIGRSTRIRNR